MSPEHLAPQTTHRFAVLCGEHGFSFFQIGQHSYASAVERCPRIRQSQAAGGALEKPGL